MDGVINVINGWKENFPAGSIPLRISRGRLINTNRHSNYGLCPKNFQFDGESGKFYDTLL
jgi:hypothetical protein